MDPKKKIVTLADLNEALPMQPLRVQCKLLQPESNELANRKRQSSNKSHKDIFDHNFPAWTAWFKNFIGRAEEDMNLENGCDPIVTEKNKKKIKKVFQKMRDNVDEHEKEVLNSMNNMTPEEQEGVLVFWQRVQKFLFHLMDHIKKVFDFLFEKIRTGYTILKETVKGFFTSLLELVKGIKYAV